MLDRSWTTEIENHFFDSETFSHSLSVNRACEHCPHDVQTVAAAAAGCRHRLVSDV
jgi:hypothetical protein